MLDLKKVRDNLDEYKQALAKRHSDCDVDMILAKDDERKALQQKVDDLKFQQKTLASQQDYEWAKALKWQIQELENQQTALQEELKWYQLKMPNFISPSVPEWKDDTENVEVERFGEPKVPDYEIPYHADIISKLNGMDKESAGRTTGEGFYYLLGDIARLHEAMIAYARDYMIDAGFTYAIPPFMIHSDVVNGVMSFKESSWQFRRI